MTDMIQPYKKNHTGFTLIEILIVMIIMGIIIAIGSTGFISAQMKSRDVKRKTAISAITKALEAYHNDTGVYPTTLPAWGSEFVDANGTIYMATLPQDPTTGRSYVYTFVSPDGYYVYAALENTNDGDIAGTYQTICGSSGFHCNYVITSQNIADPPTQ